MMGFRSCLELPPTRGNVSTIQNGLVSTPDGTVGKLLAKPRSVGTARMPQVTMRLLNHVKPTT